MISIPLAPAPPSGESRTRSDEEQTLLALLRLIDRVIGPGTLSPVERAFVSGAKIMFDQLSKECREMLKRKPSDLTRSMAPAGLPAHSVGNSSYPERVPASTIPDVAKKPKKSKSNPTADT